MIQLKSFVWNFNNNANPVDPLLRRESTPISAGGIVLHLDTAGISIVTKLPLTGSAHVTTLSMKHVRVEQGKITEATCGAHQT